MSAVVQGAALRLIADGGVAADQHESVFLPDMPSAEAGELRTRVVVALARGLAERDTSTGDLGVLPVRLTKAGEQLLEHGNPDYQSQHAFEIRDGQVGVTEVAR